ncbi:hypothetical protein BD65_170 [Yersinia ruckeri]|uniref:DUF3757 domain-containing protein n=1 Tax=Yersinia ruckeri TaxID=29486 RepID=UPI0005AD64F2|nr:DUF3757 domain-containing protein [Yersinia ruckeri]AJI94513.1 hypothetical protein BD65_170 [Yersinia ruckeri]MCW6567212.1 DUF3757 domain-containing protein [Yersinia ruckeri]
MKKTSRIGTLLLFAALSPSVLADTLHCPKVESIQSGAGVYTAQTQSGEWLGVKQGNGNNADPVKAFVEASLTIAPAEAESPQASKVLKCTYLLTSNTKLDMRYSIRENPDWQPVEDNPQQPKFWHQEDGPFGLQLKICSGSEAKAEQCRVQLLHGKIG